MKRRHQLVVWGIYLVLTACAATHDIKRRVESQTLPEITLPATENQRLSDYLGLSEPGPFTIPQIKADLVIIKLFSMYCEHCRKDAPALNKLYADIESSPGLKDKIKLIGIGAGDTASEVDWFRQKYQVPFPLFPDEDSSIHRKLGHTKFPYYIGVKLEGTDRPKIFYSEAGEITDADEFLQFILQSAGSPY